MKTEVGAQLKKYKAQFAQPKFLISKTQEKNKIDKAQIVQLFSKFL